MQLNGTYLCGHHMCDPLSCPNQYFFLYLEIVSPYCFSSTHGLNLLTFADMDCTHLKRKNTPMRDNRSSVRAYRCWHTGRDSIGKGIYIFCV